MSLLSAISSRGHMRFMIIDKGSVNASVFIEFFETPRCRRRARNLFDRRSRTCPYRATKVSAFVQTLGGKLRLFFLPPYSPDRNTDELVWKHLKADTAGRMAITSRDGFKRKVRSSLRQRRNDAWKIISFFQRPSLKYAA